MNGQPLRLPAGGAIDRGRPLAFRFDGRKLSGFAGDTLASALLASGTRLLARSFKYHRPRGVYALGSEEPNALLTLGRGARRDPNVKATTVDLREGLDVNSQNRWPSLRFDLMALNGVLSPLFVAGFYYKTFKWPASFWEPVYEHFIRRAAGLGEATRLPDPDHYARVETFCDVLVIGAGPAGLEAACTAATAGADVILVEERPWLGGRLAFERERVDGEDADAWLETMRRALAEQPRLRMLTRTAAFGLYDGHTVGLIETLRNAATASPEAPRQRSWKVRARHIVLATGALEQPLAFADNDRPGVMLAGAARGSVTRFAVAPGHRTLVLAAASDGVRTALDLARAGANVAGVVDLRERMPEEETQALAERGIDHFQHCGIARVLGRAGGRGVTLARLAHAGGTRRIACDAVAVAGGWEPAVHLHAHLGGRPTYDDARGIFLPPTLPPGHDSAGACAGIAGTLACREDGRRAGNVAAEACGYAAIAPAATDTSDGNAGWDNAGRLRVLPANHGGKRFIDLQNDVTLEDVALAHREGYRSVEHLKRYTTLGMGTDQGKTSNILGLTAMATLRGIGLDEAGTTTFRPPYVPLTVGAMVGRDTGPRFRPHREGPAEAWHRARGAVMVQAGLWHRPHYYPAHPGESRREAHLREAAHVRHAAGIVDVSTLGKIELIGPDAPVVVDRLYCNGMKKLQPGKARYGVMLRDDGFVFDDGTVCRLEDHRYLLTTTTANAGAVLSHIEFLLETAWSDLRAAAVTVSDHWAAFAIAGPRSRDGLTALFPDLALDDMAFPFLGIRRACLEDFECLIMRNSYSGERAYEVYVPADYGHALWGHAIRVGEPAGLRPYGTEAMGALRIEKGHVAGPEIDGRTTLDDLGLGRMASRRKAYVGYVLRHRAALQQPDRPTLVGLEALDAEASLRAGALLRAAGSSGADAVAGHVTSVTYSPTCEGTIALGLLARGAERHGEVVEAHDPLAGRDVRLRVRAPVFIDPEGTRLHA